MGKLAEQLRKTIRQTKEYRKEVLRETTTIDAPLPSPAVHFKVPNTPNHGLSIAVITDTQIREGVPVDHIGCAGRFLAEKQPEVVLCIGDWWDFPSLSTHSAPGSLEKENRRYRKDLIAGRDAMELLLNPIAKVSGYNPALIFCEGNHEDRIERTVKAHPQFDTMSKKDLRLSQYGWKVIPFLQPIVIEGVAFCHYFPSGVMGKPVQSPSILLRKLHMSAFAGHQQGRDIAYSRRADGGNLTAIISGSFYQHDEPYLSPLANRHWRGFYMLHEVKDGNFDEMAVSINYLKRKFN